MHPGRTGSRRTSWRRFALIAPALALVAAACASGPRPEDVIFRSPFASVYLERASADNFQATHPVTLGPEVVERLLKGVLVIRRKTAMDTMFSNKESLQRVFSDEEVAFLAPLLAGGLARAKPWQQVRFTLVQPPAGPNHLLSMSETGGAGVGSSEPATYGPQYETSSGVLFVFRPSLHLILTQYRQRPTRPDSINMPNRRLPDAGGLDRIELLFAPKSALLPESYQDPGWFGEDHLTPIVVDYERLAKLPEPKPQPPPATGTPAPPAATPPPATAQPPPGEGTAGQADVQALKESLSRQEQELKALKEQIESLKGEHGDPKAQPKKPKSQKKPSPPDPTP